MNRAITYRLYPTADQAVLFAKTFGCCRKIWNLMLADREKAYAEDKRKIQPTPAQYKSEYPFLREVDSLALANVQLDLEGAYRRFFSVKGAGHPRFKAKKHGRETYTTNNQDGTVSIRSDTSTIRLPKLGFVKAVLHRLPPEGWELKSATVSRTSSGKYYCAVLFYAPDPVPEAVCDPTKNAIGLDYKSDGFFADSNGQSPGSPKCYRKSQKSLTKEQRKLRHKVKGSRNYEKQKIRIARKYEKIASQRKDFLHKESTAIAKRYDLVAVESLNMRAMSNKAFGNGTATLDNGWGKFIKMLEYKLQERDKVLVHVDKWFPSSQACNSCGCINPNVRSLNVRKWTCPSCGAVHDRDINAARNILKEGIRMYKSVESA